MAECRGLAKFYGKIIIILLMLYESQLGPVHSAINVPRGVRCGLHITAFRIAEKFANANKSNPGRVFGINFALIDR